MTRQACLVHFIYSYKFSTSKFQEFETARILKIQKTRTNLKLEILLLWGITASRQLRH